MKSSLSYKCNLLISHLVLEAHVLGFSDSAKVDNFKCNPDNSITLEEIRLTTSAVQVFRSRARTYIHRFIGLK